MRVLKKMSFDALVGNISIEDMKFIVAGSGSAMNGRPYNQPFYTGGGGSGNMGYYATDRGMSSQFSPAGTLLFTPNGNYNSPSVSSNQNTYGYGGNTNINNSYGRSGNTSPVTNGTGWVSTASGMTTNDPLSINRLFGLINSNYAQNADPSQGINAFLLNETTPAGRAQNDALYGGWLREVVVINKYKGPSTVPIGIVIDNGSLHLRTGVLMGSGGVTMGSGSSTTTSYSSWFGMAINGSDSKPSVLEAAILSKAAYGDKIEDSKDFERWNISKPIDGVLYNDPKSGFKSQLYERLRPNGKMEYCYVTTGTEPGDYADYAADALQALGISKQYYQSVENAKILSKLYGDALSYAGHSLGGGMAEANARATGQSATTFSAAGLSNSTAILLGIGFISDTNSYIMINDPLNIAQTVIPGLRTAGGEKHFVNFEGTSERHSIDTMIKSLKKNPK